MVRLIRGGSVLEKKFYPRDPEQAPRPETTIRCWSQSSAVWRRPPR